jgi:NADH-quinone oxidoreductase subunit E
MDDQAPAAGKAPSMGAAHGGLSLVSFLQDIQGRHGYLPEEELRALSQKLGLPLVEVYHAATFYNSFSLVPRGRHQIVACAGTTCHVRGAARIADEISRLLDVRPGEVTPDREFSFDTVNCLGCCAFAPVMVIDGKYYGNLSTGDVRRIIGSLAEGTGTGVIRAPEEVHR